MAVPVGKQRQIPHVHRHCHVTPQCGLYTENREDELQKEHYLRLHECKAAPSSYEVIPIHNILGKLALMPDCVTPTIPRHHDHQKKRAFPRGEVGCKVFYVNHFALTWARSKIILRRCVSHKDNCCVQLCLDVPL